jgi:uncharacterized protein YdeI (YjbR/CyaY-like superfamily)
MNFEPPHRPKDMTLAPGLLIDEIHVPADLALWMDAEMHAFFNDLSRKQKRRYVEWIDQATTAEVRERRIGWAVQMMRDERSR